MLTTETDAPMYTREIPLGFNGYVTVAQPALRIAAAEVREGDTLILDGYVSRVHGIRVISLSSGHDLSIRHPQWDLATVIANAHNVNADWPVLHITGDVNIVRFPHELVSVIRAA